MKIYDLKAFVSGMVFLCTLLLDVLNVIQLKGWTRMIALVFAAKYLYTGLSKEESKRQHRIARNYHSVSRKFYGKYGLIKINLPWLIAGGFLVAGLLIRMIWDIVIPGWIVLCFVVALTISLFYSIGLIREVINHIEEERKDKNSDGNA